MHIFDAGCDCRGVTSENSTCNDKICKFECTVNETKCSTIKAMKESIYIWRKKKFCYTHNNISNYYNLLLNSVKKGNQCKEGYKQCGILDNHNNIACYPN